MENEVADRHLTPQRGFDPSRTFLRRHVLRTLSIAQPDVVDLAWIEQNLTWNPPRANLFRQLQLWITSMETCRLKPHALIIGGSFYSDKNHPSDIDGLFVYSAAEGFNHASLRRLLKSQREIDMHAVPVDGPLSLLIKTVMSVQYLFAGDDLLNPRACIIVNL